MDGDESVGKERKGRVEDGRQILFGGSFLNFRSFLGVCCFLYCGKGEH